MIQNGFFRFAWIAVALAVSLFACTRNVTGSGKNGPDKSSGKKVTVSGTVFRTENYCGGAAPSREMLEEFRKPKPWAGAKFYLRSGDHNAFKPSIADSFTVSADGSFSVQLPAGDWCLLLAQQRDTSLYAPWRKKNSNVSADFECLKKWWGSCQRIITVGQTPIDTIQLKYHQPCFLPAGIPCLQFNGPYPP